MAGIAARRDRHGRLILGSGLECENRPRGGRRLHVREDDPSDVNTALIGQCEGMVNRADRSGFLVATTTRNKRYGLQHAPPAQTDCH